MSGLVLSGILLKAHQHLVVSLLPASSGKNSKTNLRRFNNKMSSSQAHLQIYTGPIHRDDGASFHIFPQLPPEIRCLIWRQLLERPRLVKLCLWDKQRIVIGADSDYRISADNAHRLNNRLLRVNMESRQLALRFYRVHIPCTFTKERIQWDAPSTREERLYVNPEYDFLYITSDSSHLHTASFLYDLKTVYDPRNVGLLNLAIDSSELTMLFYSLDVPNLAAQIRPEVKSGFANVISQLREVFFVTVTSVGRQVHRYLHGFFLDRNVFNRSYPIMAITADFDRLHRDPRDISEDLKDILMATFPRQDIFHFWTQLLHKFEISPTRISYRLLLASKPFPAFKRINDRGSANAWLQKEDDMWWEASKEDPHEPNSRPGMEQAVKPAIGFWLFPIEALDAIPEDGTPWSEGSMLDLSKYWPELALFSL